MDGRVEKIALLLAFLVTVAFADSWIGDAKLRAESATAGEHTAGLSVGLLVPLTGERAEEGRSAKRGFELAAFETAPEYAVELEDSRCDVGYAAGAVDRLVAAEVDLAVGGLCPEVAELARERFAEAGIDFMPLETENAGPEADARLTARHLELYGSEPDAAALSADAAARAAFRHP